jgi:hypothetical protein
MLRVLRLWRRVRWGRRCAKCHVSSWLNPPSDHFNWLGHDWQRDKASVRTTGWFHVAFTTDPSTVPGAWIDISAYVREARFHRGRLDRAKEES